MTDAIDRQARAEAAERLLADPLFNEAFNAFELALMNRAIEAPVRDDDGRRRCLDAVNTLRKVRSHIKTVISEGKTAAHNAALAIAPDALPEKHRWFGNR